METFGWPEYLGAGLGAFLVYPILCWVYGAVRVTDALMIRFEQRPKAPGEFATIGLVLYGMILSGVFGLMILGLILRGVAYGPTGGY
jgi:hypothetical protein